MLYRDYLAKKVFFIGCFCKFFPRVLSSIVALLYVLAAGTVSGAFMPAQTLFEASKVAKTDGIGAGWCGRGVWSVLSKIGYGQGIRSGDGQDWEVILSDAGWVPLSCPIPSMAPYGSILVYMSDMRLHGRNKVGTKGGIHGHVELVAVDPKLGRVYVSDKPRVKPGGTVPMNFTKRAWVPAGYVYSVGQPVLAKSTFNPKLALKQASQLRDERIELAMVVFNKLQ
jgi:hypothetical protein